MKFHIVTPCIGPNEQLLRTIASVRAQTLFNLKKSDSQLTHSVTYIVQLCAEGPLDEVSNPTTHWPSIANLNLEVSHSPDDGIYDALRMGFSRAEDNTDVFFYVGAGDILSPNALEIVSDILTRYKEVDWLTGFICGLNDKGHMTDVLMPYCYRNRLIKCGAYGRYLPFIQQESTFWTARLHNQIDWDVVTNRKLAGDAELWHQFSRVANLYITEAWLGGFERRSGQLSEDQASYLAELHALSTRPSAYDLATILVDKIIWSAPRFVKRRFSLPRFIYDSELGHYVLS